MIIPIINKYIINQNQADELYRSCNKYFFDYGLDFPDIILVDNPLHAGEFKFDINFDKYCLENFRIEISINRKRSDDNYVSTMVHEMIHYKIVSELSKKDVKKAIKYIETNEQNKADKILCTGEYAHADKFIKIADDINNKYKIYINRN